MVVSLRHNAALIDIILCASSYSSLFHPFEESIIIGNVRRVVIAYLQLVTPKCDTVNSC